MSDREPKPGRPEAWAIYSGEIGNGLFAVELSERERNDWADRGYASEPVAIVPLADVERWRAIESSADALQERLDDCARDDEPYIYLPGVEPELLALRAALGSKP